MTLEQAIKEALRGPAPLTFKEIRSHVRGTDHSVRTILWIMAKAGEITRHRTYGGRGGGSNCATYELAKPVVCANCQHPMGYRL